MTDGESIQSNLTAAAWRVRGLRAWRAAWLGLFCWGCFWLLSLLVFKLYPIPFGWIASLLFLAPGVGAVFALAAAGRSVPLSSVARAMDARLQTQERVGTAFEFLQSPGTISEEWRRAVISDAARLLDSVRIPTVFPIGLPRIARGVLAVLLVGLCLGFAPEYRTAQQLRTARDSQLVREAGREVLRFAKQTLTQRAPKIESTRRALMEAQELGEHLAQSKVSRDEALKELAALSERLRQETRELERDPGIRKVQESTAQRNAAGSASAELQRRMDALNSQMGAGATDSRSLADFQKDLAKAREAAAGLSSNGGPLDSAAINGMQGMMAALASRAQSAGLSMPHLAQAIEALKNAQIDQVLNQLDASMRDLERMQQMAEAVDAMKAEAEGLGKTLAEQLKLGQTQAAIQTLDRMRNALADPKLSREQQREILKEVADSLKAAKAYGEAGGHMERAATQLRADDRGKAADALEKAAQELARLAEAAEEGEALEATLQVLQQAQSSVGSGLAWGQCKGPPSAGRGGKPGRGVGTWAEDDSAEVVDATERWDNSQTKRDDLDPRGITDRPEERSSNLIPTKVQGQIKPGGPMPSITLKGLSVRGQSRIEFTDAIPAAQSQAQSALNQDQVPRVYRGAVREYFNDLKQ